jgi:hypothetical protein
VDRIGEQLDPLALIRDQTAEKRIVRRLDFDGGKQACLGQSFLVRDDHGAESESHAIQKARDREAGIKIGDLADALQVASENFLIGLQVEAGDRTDPRVTQGRNDSA